jgi:hypothetical protein
MSDRTTSFCNLRAQFSPRRKVRPANQSTYSVADVEAANIGVYTVTVTNVVGATTSSNAILDVPIQFTISFTNQYVNRASAPLSLAIQSGVPYYWAVLLDNTNFGGASWTAYTSSNITANLGATQGWHTVWVGLCGPAAGSQATWNAVRLDLDLTTPICLSSMAGTPPRRMAMRSG